MAFGTGTTEVLQVLVIRTYVHTFCPSIEVISLILDLNNRPPKVA